MTTTTIDALRSAMEKVEELNETIPEGDYLTLMNALQQAYRNAPETHTHTPTADTRRRVLEVQQQWQERARAERTRVERRAERERNGNGNNTRNFLGGLWLRGVTEEMLAERATRTINDYNNWTGPIQADYFLPKTFGQYSQLIYLYKKWQLMRQNDNGFAELPAHEQAERAVYSMGDGDLATKAMILRDTIIARFPGEEGSMDDLYTRYDNRGQMFALAQHEFKKAYTVQSSMCLREGHYWRFFEALFPEVVAEAPAPAPEPEAPAPVAEAPARRRRIVVVRAPTA